MGTSSFQIYFLLPSKLPINSTNNITHFTELEEDSSREETPSHFLPFLPSDEDRESAGDLQVDRDSRSDEAGQRNQVCLD